MEKELINGWEELTGYKATKIAEEIILSDLGRFSHQLTLKKDGQVLHMCFNRHIPFNPKWFKGIYELSRGNIFWKDEYATGWFNDYLKYSKDDLLNVFGNIQRNLGYESRAVGKSIEAKVIKWILKFKYGLETDGK